MNILDFLFIIKTHKTPKMKTVLILISATLMFASCTSNKLISKSVKASEITENAYLDPISFISYIEKGNKAALSDSLSQVSKMLLDSIIAKNPNFEIPDKVVIENQFLKNKIEDELSGIFMNVIRTHKIEGVKMTPTIDSVLKNQKQRFVLATVVSGFGRRKGNYGGQIAKGLGVGLLTLGMYTPVPIKSNTTLFAMIIDTKNNEIVYFRNGLSVEKSPTERKVLEQQYKKLFDGYLYNVVSQYNEY